MEFISKDKISEELINSFYEEMTLKFAKKLEEYEHKIIFVSLRDWHLLRAFAIKRPELITNHINLLNQEPFYEN